MMTKKIAEIIEGPKKIPLSRGLIVLVDFADYEFLSQWKWSASASDTAVRQVRDPETGNSYIQQMSRLILGIERGDNRHVRFIDGNSLNCQRDNLRIRSLDYVKPKKVPREQPIGKSGFRGVTLHKETGRWRAIVWRDRKEKSLGYFSSPKKANEAREHFIATGERLPLDDDELNLRWNRSKSK